MFSFEDRWIYKSYSWKNFPFALSIETKRERKHTERRGIIYQGCVGTRIENRSCLFCFARARNRCILFVVSVRKPSTLSKTVDFRQKARFTSGSLQFSALLSNDNVHNSSVPESFTISWSTRMRDTSRITGGTRKETNRRSAGKADVRRHGELFIKPSSRRISDRTTSHVMIHAVNTKLCLLIYRYSLKFHMLMEKNLWWSFIILDGKTGFLWSLRDDYEY